MILEITNNLVRIIVLDISGVYAQIYDEATLPLSKVDSYIASYSDTSQYKIVKIL